MQDSPWFWSSKPLVHARSRLSRNARNFRLSSVRLISHAQARTEGALDDRGELDVAKDAPVGFQRIALRFDLDTDASDERLATL
jgi:hypothetical protein